MTIRPKVPRGARFAALLLVAATAGLFGQVPAAQDPQYPDEANGQPSDVLTSSPLAPCGEAAPAPGNSRRPMRIVSWNIRAARAAPLDEIAAELQAMQADIVALQEVDVRVRRTRFVDEPQALAAALGFHYAFTASIKWQGGDYGLAVLSRWPIADVRRHRLDNTGARELRIVMDVTVCANGRPLRLLNHHADVRDEPRVAGLKELATLVGPQVGKGVVVLGDFNDSPETDGVRALLNAGLIDLVARHETNASTMRIDYVLADAPLASLTSTARVWRTDRSDHNAVIVEIDR